MFEYLSEKVSSADFKSDPFKHLYIEDFFSEEHFHSIIRSSDVNLAKANNDEELIAALHEANYKELQFPGATTEIEKYLSWHKSRRKEDSVNLEICEGFGVVMRLQRATSPVVRELKLFLESDLWLDSLAKKFSVDRAAVRNDNGIQKYLDGYEISPHPDIRGKALTYMVNINPADNAEEVQYHTHYMRFTADRAQVSEFWRNNKHIDRCWVPWSWCETIALQTKNNSIVVFQPSDDTIHAVKAAYDHLSSQRTQLYGNLWYLDGWPKERVEWRNLPTTS